VKEAESQMKKSLWTRIGMINWRSTGILIVKQILWSVLAFIIIAFVHTTATTALYPYGGNEYHAIFSDFSGGRLNVAYRVYIEYAAIASVLVFVMIIFRYPAHWFIVLCIGSWIAWKRWFDLCFFPYQSEHFHDVCVRLGFFIAPIVSYTGFFARFLLWWFTRKRRQNDKPDKESVDGLKASGSRRLPMGPAARLIRTD
jgi:hypothetical protein